MMVLAVLAAVVVLGGCDRPVGEPSTTSTSSTRTPSEGEPGFDCELHGNRVCGPQETRAAGTVAVPVPLAVRS